MTRDSILSPTEHGDLLLADADGGPDLVREQIELLFCGRREPEGAVGLRALMRALLQDAVVCLAGQAAPSHARPQLAVAALAWVRSHSRNWPFAFESVCDVLGIEASYLRPLLLRLAVPASGDPSMPAVAMLGRVRLIRRSRSRPKRAIHFMRARKPRRGDVPTPDEAATSADTSFAATS